MNNIVFPPRDEEVSTWLAECKNKFEETEKYDYYSSSFVFAISNSVFNSECKDSIVGKYDWYEWEECSKTCATGYQIKMAQQCQPPGAVCNGLNLERRDCNNYPCLCNTAEIEIHEQCYNIADIEQNMNKMDENIAGIDENMAKIEGNIAEIDENIAKMDGNIAEMDENMVKIDENIAEIDQNIATIDENLAKMDGNIAGIDENMAEMDDNIAALDNNIAGIDESIADIDTNLADIDNNIAAIDENIGEINGNIAVIDSKTASEFLRVDKERMYLEEKHNYDAVFLRLP